jgi:HEAT repeats
LKLKGKKRTGLTLILSKLRSADANLLGETFTEWGKFDKTSIRPLISVLKNFDNARNREAAAYGLISFLLELETKKCGKCLRYKPFKRLEIIEKARRDIKFVINNLLETVEKDESEKVRAQALETLGMSWSARKPRHRLRKKVEKIVIDALADDSPEVRFWACYAAGQLNIENALPKLRELVENDTLDWGQWWLISEEAEDAIDWIQGRDTEARIPFAQRNDAKS